MAALAFGASPTSTSAINWADAWDDLSDDEWAEGEQAPPVLLPSCNGGESDDDGDEKYAAALPPPVIALPGADDNDRDTVPMPVSAPIASEDDDVLSPLPPRVEVKHYKSGGRYEGPLHPDTGLPHGEFGTFFYPIGHRYEGPWYNGKKHGEFGIFYFNNGCRFEGQWQDNMRHGIGTQYDPSGQWQRNEYANNRVSQLLARGLGGDAEQYLRSLPMPPDL